MDAQKGDRITVESNKVGGTTRTGEVVEVILGRVRRPLRRPLGGRSRDDLLPEQRRPSHRALVLQLDEVAGARSEGRRSITRVPERAPLEGEAAASDAAVEVVAQGLEEPDAAVEQRAP